MMWIMQQKKPQIAVIYAPFQVPTLDDFHISFFERLRSQHEKIAVLLPVRRLPPTPSAPYNFENRKNLLSPFADVILPVLNHKYPETQVRAIDEAIDLYERTLQSSRYCKLSLVLYLDVKFEQTYRKHGKIPRILTNEFLLRDASIREDSLNLAPSECRYMDGLLHALCAQWPIQSPVVDIVIFRNTDLATDGHVTGEFLLGRKPGEKNFRFPGGFKDPADASYEETVYREAAEETLRPGVDPKKVFRHPIYKASMNVKDWRLESGDDWGQVTSLFMLEFYGDESVIHAGDDLEEVRWFKVKDLKSGNAPIESEHVDLLSKALSD